MINWNFNPNDVYTVVIGFVALVPFARKYLPAIKKAAPIIETVVADTEHLVSDLAKTPWFAGVAATTELKVHHVVAKLEDTTLARVAATGLAAFSNDLGKMTVIQKANLSEWVKAELKKIDVTVSDQHVMAALQVAQTAVDKVRAEILPAVQKQDAAVQAWAAKDQAGASAS